MTTHAAPFPDLHETMLMDVNRAVDGVTFGASDERRLAAVPFPPGRILVGHDMSREAETALAWAGHLATVQRAHVVVANVTPPPAAPLRNVGGPLYWPAILDAQREIEHRARRSTDSAAELLRGAGADAESVATVGRPADELVAVAAAHAADLVIVGARAGGGVVVRALMGSVADAVAHRASANVLVARTTPPARRVLAATDGSAESRAAVAAALRYASLTMSDLVVQHVVEFSGDASQAPTEGYLKGVVEEMALPPLPRVRYVVDVGRPGREIVRRAEAEGSDLVVVGARGLGRWSGLLLGSVSRRVAAAAPASVLIVRAGPET